MQHRLLIAVIPFDGYTGPIPFRDGALIGEIVCPKCPSIYQATQKRAAHDSVGRFDCSGCGAKVHVWSGRYDYTDWQTFGAGTKID
jgi:hypothetical protein